MLRVAQRSPRKHRYGHQRGLRDIDGPIEAGAAGRRRHRHAQLLPVALGREAQLLDGGAEDVVGDADLSVGEHDALGRDRAVRQIAALAMELGQRVEHLLQHEHCRADGDRLAARCGPREHLGQTSAAGEIVDKADGSEPAWPAKDVANRQKGRVIELLEQPEPLVERELERRHRGQLGSNQQTLVRGAPVCVANQHPVAEAIPENEVIGGEIR